MGIKSLFTGDYGHEDRYVNGAAAQNGRYSPDKLVAAQIKDSDDRNQSRGNAKSAASGAVKGVSGFLDWLAK
jgi:hypothetical protein